jgi:hypothetical protein
MLTTRLVPDIWIAEIWLAGGFEPGTRRIKTGRPLVKKSVWETLVAELRHGCFRPSVGQQLG